MKHDKTLQQARELISRRFAERRKELGLTQEELAEYTGLGVATIKRFESAKFWIGLKQLLLMSIYLELSPIIEDRDPLTPLVEAMEKVKK